VTIADDNIYEPKIEKSSGNLQMDVDCLQAVLGATHYKTKAHDTGLTLQTFTFDSSKPVGHKTSAIKQLLENHDSSKSVYFYRIPLDVLKRYPGTFDENELLSEKNIGTLLKNSAIEDLRIQYGNWWADFFMTHPTATKEEISQYSITHYIRR
jgi:hypothetical protein